MLIIMERPWLYLFLLGMAIVNDDCYNVHHWLYGIIN